MSVFKDYTLEEYTNTHGFEFFVYDDTKEGYAFGGEFINPNSLEWEYLKNELIIEFDETLNEILTLIIATIPEEEEGNFEEFEEPTIDDIYRANGFASEADFWRWKEGL